MKVYLVYEDNGVEGYTHQHIFNTKELAEEYVKHRDGLNSEWLRIEEMDVVDYSCTKFYVIETCVWSYYSGLHLGLEEHASTNLDRDFYNETKISDFETYFRIAMCRKNPISQLERQKFDNFRVELNNRIGLIPRDEERNKIKELADSIKQKFEEIFRDG